MLDENVLTLGSLTIQKGLVENFESYTSAKVKTIGKFIPFHVTGEGIDLLLGYAKFINNERDIRTLSIQKDFNTFDRLKHGLRLTIQPVADAPHKLYAELRQAFPKDNFDKHQTLHSTTSEMDLDQGAGLSVFEELKKVGAEVGTKQELLGDIGKRASYLCVRFDKKDLWAPIVAYTATRILPIKLGYRG